MSTRQPKPKREIKIGSRVAKREGILHLGEGSFTWLCAITAFGYKRVHRYGITCRSNEEIVDLISRNQARYGMLPIDNGQAGSVIGSANQLHKVFLDPSGRHIAIFAAIDYLVEFALFTFRKRSVDDLGDIVRVLGHMHGLPQCNRFLSTRLAHAEREPQASNVVGISQMMATQDDTMAAICPSQAQAIYGGHIVEDKIQDDPKNRTRILIIEPAFYELPLDPDMFDASGSLADLPVPLSDEMFERVLETRSITRRDLADLHAVLASQYTLKNRQSYQTIIIYALKDQVLSLDQVLIELGIEEINNSRIFLQSASLDPAEEGYAFFMSTIEGHESSKRLQAAFARIREKTQHFAVVGSFATPRKSEDLPPID